jgi:cell wall-associated NlpC family hydrolase
MRLPKSWKILNKPFISVFLFLFAGCSLQTVSVRPSFDKDYKNNWGNKSSSVRPSYSKKYVESTDIIQEENEQDDDTAEFEIIDRKPDGISISGGNIKKSAEKYLGSPYYYGGTTKRGFDCSGFVWRVFQDAGYTSFQRETAQAMFNGGKPVSQNSLREGDLCFFHSPKNKKKIDHTGIYISGGEFIHSSSSRGVAYSNLSDSYWKDNFVGFKRLLP